MYGVVDGVYYCNQQRDQELSNRIYDRNIPSKLLQMEYNPPRSVPTRYVRFPALDCRLPSSVPLQKFPPYNQMTQFNPGQGAPYSGYATYIDQDSRLKDIFMAAQKNTAQTQYIPSSQSDMFNVNVTTTHPVHMTNQELFTKEQFAPFNPNPCNLGNEILHNHTRQQIKNLPISTNNTK